MDCKILQGTSSYQHVAHPPYYKGNFVNYSAADTSNILLMKIKGKTQTNSFPKKSQCQIWMNLLYTQDFDFFYTSCLFDRVLLLSQKNPRFAMNMSIS